MVSGGVAAGVLVDGNIDAMAVSTERRSDVESNSVGEDSGVDAGVAKFAVDDVDNFAGWASVLIDNAPNGFGGAVEVAAGLTSLSKSGIDDKKSFKVVAFAWLVAGIADDPGTKVASTDKISGITSCSAGVFDILVAVERALTRAGGTAVSIHGDLGGAVVVGLTSGLTKLEEGPADLTVGGADLRWLSGFDFLAAAFVSDDTSNCAFLFLALAMASGDRLSTTEARTTLASSSKGYVH